MAVYLLGVNDGSKVGTGCCVGAVGILVLGLAVKDGEAVVVGREVIDTDGIYPRNSSPRL